MATRLANRRQAEPSARHSHKGQRRMRAARWAAAAFGCLACTGGAPAHAARPDHGIAVTFVSRFGGDLDGDGRLDRASLEPADAPTGLGLVEVIAQPRG